MKLKEEKYDVGVIVGRFQVPYLHEAHINLINSVNDRHPNKVIILLGIPPTLSTRNNPLDFEMRKQMIISMFPNVIVLPINDNVSNEKWSKNLDLIISTIGSPNQKVVIYGGRDSFKPFYSGKFPVLEFESEGYFSGTEVRKGSSLRAIDTSDFRSGVIWGIYNRFPIVYTTVDIAIFKNPENKEILLARKPNEKLFRFVGGFSEPNSECFELDARREVMEEVGIEVSEMKYVGSFKVEDWRYNKEIDKVKTILYYCTYVFGNPKADDDIEEIEWFDFEKMTEEKIVPEHRKLFNYLKEFIKKG